MCVSHSFRSHTHTHTRVFWWWLFNRRGCSLTYLPFPGMVCDRQIDTVVPIVRHLTIHCTDSGSPGTRAHDLMHVVREQKRRPAASDRSGAQPHRTNPILFLFWLFCGVKSLQIRPFANNTSRARTVAAAPAVSCSCLCVYVYLRMYDRCYLRCSVQYYGSCYALAQSAAVVAAMVMVVVQCSRVENNTAAQRASSERCVDDYDDDDECWRAHHTDRSQTGRRICGFKPRIYTYLCGIYAQCERRQ